MSASDRIARRRNDSSFRTAYFPLPAARCLLPANRPGISLLEVLFAIGVLSVGILGMAALVPLGAYELVEAQKLDQSSTAGRAAFRDLEVRNYLQPKMWVDTQLGMLIDPDPTNGYAASPATYQNRIMNYPYIPPHVYQYYFSSIQLLSSSPPAGLSTPPYYTQASAPYMYPAPFPTYASGNAAPPIGINLLAQGTYPQLPNGPFGPYPSGVTGPPFPPFAATEGHVFVFDPLGVAEAGLNLQNSPPHLNGRATVPSFGYAPASWTYIQTFPYQQTYNLGAPLLPRITTLPEWPKWPINGTQWSVSTGPMTPIPYWPVPAIQYDGTNKLPWPGTTPQLPAVQASPTSPWPQPWFQSTAASATIQATPRFMPLVTADRIFRSTDDLIFNPQNVANPASDRPTQAFAYDSAGTNRLEPLYQGNYSWFATISPSSAESDSTSQDMQDSVTNPDPAALINTRRFNVSVVVCTNRNLTLPDPSHPLATDTTPGEWQVPARIEPGSLGGGEVTLFADPGHGANQAAWLATLKPGQWLMLSGITVSPQVRQDPSNPGNYYYWPRLRTIANWYRIAAVDDGAALILGGGYRSVTINGADWPQGIQWDDPLVNGTGNTPPILFGATSPAPQGVQFACLNTISAPSYPPANPSANPTYPNVNIYAYATVVDGVVGVYQKTITVDGDSPFSSP